MNAVPPPFWPWAYPREQEAKSPDTPPLQIRVALDIIKHYNRCVTDPQPTSSGFFGLDDDTTEAEGRELAGEEQACYNSACRLLRQYFDLEQFIGDDGEQGWSCNVPCETGWYLFYSDHQHKLWFAFISVTAEGAANVEMFGPEGNIDLSHEQGWWCPVAHPPFIARRDLRQVIRRTDSGDP